MDGHSAKAKASRHSAKAYLLSVGDTAACNEWDLHARGYPTAAMLHSRAQTLSCRAAIAKRVRLPKSASPGWPAHSNPSIDIMSTPESLPCSAGRHHDGMHPQHVHA